MDVECRLEKVLEVPVSDRLSFNLNSKLLGLDKIANVSGLGNM